MTLNPLLLSDMFSHTGTGNGAVYHRGKKLPLVHLSAHNQATLDGAHCYSSTESSTEAYRPLTGMVRDYMAEDAPGFKPVSSYSEVPLDPSMVTFANNQGLVLEEYLEILDPSSQYKLGDPLRDLTALDRQLYRYGYIQPKTNLRTPAISVPLLFSIANTPANSVLFPAYTNQGLFWTPIDDLELDPSFLVRGTRRQKEQFIKTVVVNDASTPHRRLHVLSESAMPPNIRMSLSGYSGGFVRHGLSFSYSKDFARHVTLDLYTQALGRAALRERVALFNHILEVFQNGYRTYGIASGISTVKAVSLDPTGITSAGEISYISVLLMLYSMRPYMPDHILMNINTYLAYIQATPPANMLESTLVDTLSRMKVPGLPSPKVTASNWFTNRPNVIVVPEYMLADNLLIFHNVKNSLERVVQIGSEVNETEYSVTSQSYTNVMLMQTSLSPLPSYKDAVKAMTLTL